MTASVGRFTQIKIDAALAEVCGKVDLDPHSATLIKMTNNAVFRLTNAPVVVRLATSKAMRHRVAKVVVVARWLSASGFPSVRLIEDIEQPVVAGDHIATIWHVVEEHGPPPTGSDLGHLIRRFHELEPPDSNLPNWDPLDDIRRRIGDAEGLSEADHRYLIDQCDEAGEALARVEYTLPAGPIHGDAFLGNIIPSAHGPVLCDFDSTSIGPREWDLIPVALGQIRFGHPPSQQADFAAAYRLDVTRWSGFPVLRRIRELKLVTSALPVIASRPGLRQQVEHRLRSLRTGDQGRTWTPYR
jgi:hypothetical protein